jgi:6-phosphogluconolactonase
MQILRFSDQASFVQASLDRVRSCVRKNPQAVIGLCGGSTPISLYKAMAHDDSVDYSSVIFFLLDERYVPRDHPDSNQRMVSDSLFSGRFTDANFLAPNIVLLLDECIQDYQKRLMKELPQNDEGVIDCDLIIIGMGNDGHITSLFPPLSDAAFGPMTVMHTTTNSFAVHDRVSVTIPLLVAVKERIFLITGQEKSELLETMQYAPIDPRQYPAQALFDERTTWMVQKINGIDVLPY